MAVDQDWGWVLERTCPDCRADVLGIPLDNLGPRTRTLGGAWRTLLARGGSLATRPTEGERTWSVLEYGCHVHDVFEVFEERIRTMLKKRKPPTFRNWDPDQAAIDGDYANAEADHVAYALAVHAGKVADVLDRVGGDEWDKGGMRSDGAEFTVESIARYLLHDVEHHLWDAHQILDGA